MIERNIPGIPKVHHLKYIAIINLILLNFTNKNKKIEINIEKAYKIDFLYYNFKIIILTHHGSSELNQFIASMIYSTLPLIPSTFIPLFLTTFR